MIKLIAFILIFVTSFQVPAQVLLGQNAVSIAGRAVSVVPPTNGQVLTYNSTTARWEAAAGAAGGAGDIESVTAGTGISGGGTTGAVTVNALMHPDGVLNCSIDSSVAANALTVHIKTAAGATPSASDPCVITFRNTTATTGTVSQVSVTAATTAVITDDGTLGCVIGQTCALYVYALNNAGTVVAAVGAFKLQDEGAVMSSTTASSGSDTVGTLYSTTGVASVAGRLMGELQIVLGATSHWSANSAKISNVPFKPYGSDWTTFTPVPTTNSGSMTNATHTGKWRRNFDTISVNIYTVFSGASGTWVAYYAGLPPSCVLDTTKTVGTSDHAVFEGAVQVVDNGTENLAGQVGYTGGGGSAIAVYPFVVSGTNIKDANMSNAVPIAFGASDSISAVFNIPCTGW